MELFITFIFHLIAHFSQYLLQYHANWRVIEYLMTVIASYKPGVSRNKLSTVDRFSSDFQNPILISF